MTIAFPKKTSAIKFLVYFKLLNPSQNFFYQERISFASFQIFLCLHHNFDNVSKTFFENFKSKYYFYKISHLK